jgi:hypothetical protein
VRVNATGGSPLSPSWIHPLCIQDVQAHHGAGVVFKLHPRRATRSVAEFDLEHGQLSALALQLWLWLEGRRLQKSFRSASDYALNDMDKCPGTKAWKNYLLSLRTFGQKATVEAGSWRYPRERLFNALALLLWQAEGVAQSQILCRLQRELQTNAPDWVALVNVFKGIWPRYG